MPKIIWHRCNNIKMMQAAIKAERDGVVGLEYDVIAALGNVPVLFHDKFLPDGREVAQIPVEELYDIASLEDAFSAISDVKFSQKFEFHLEIKPYDVILIDNIIKILAKFPKIAKQTTIRSFQEKVLQYLHKNHPNQQLCLLLGNVEHIREGHAFPGSNKTSLAKLPDVAYISKICSHTPHYVAVDYRMLTQEFIENMAKSAIEVEVYTLNDLSGLNGLKVDRVTSDRPLEL